MLCGLPIPSFQRKVKRVRPVISAPLPQGLAVMNFNGRANNPAGDDGNESGVYYLVTKPGTGEKQIVKRPRPPPSATSPLDDDFDAYTQTNIGTTSRLPVGSEDVSRSRSLAASGTSPRGPGLLQNAHDASSGSIRRPPPANNVETSYPKMTPPRRVQPPKLPSETHVSPQPQHQLHSPSSEQQSTIQGNKGKSREAVKESYGEYKEYMNEIGKMFGKHGDFDISINRINETSGMRESVNLGRVQSHKSSPSNRHGNRSAVVGKGNPNIGRNASTSTHSRAPKPRQAYEEVSRRVIENTPEKTVTISTWREQVAQESQDAERMSVYWYTQGDFQGDLTKSEVDGDKTRGSRSSGQSGRDGALPPNRVVVHQIDHRISRSDGQNSSVEDESPLRKETLVASNKPTIRHEYRPPPRSPQAQKLTIKPSKKQAPPSSSGPPSPASTTGFSEDDDDEDPPTPPPKPPRLSLKTMDIMQSTPIDNRVTMPSFHPTKDGSVITTIRSTSSESSLTFENVLESCKPPLAHLTPVLGKLGITSVGHLRALADLNPEIRDRELKEDALKLGVTAMEWAILVDRLRLL